MKMLHQLDISINEVYPSTYINSLLFSFLFRLNNGSSSSTTTLYTSTASNATIGIVRCDLSCWIDLFVHSTTRTTKTSTTSPWRIFPGKSTLDFNQLSSLSTHRCSLHNSGDYDSILSTTKITGTIIEKSSIDIRWNDLQWSFPIHQSILRNDFVSTNRCLSRIDQYISHHVFDWSKSYRLSSLSTWPCWICHCSSTRASLLSHIGSSSFVELLFHINLFFSWIRTVTMWIRISVFVFTNKIENKKFFFARGIIAKSKDDSFTHSFSPSVALLIRIRLN